jgi:hypothetical protein
LADVDLINVTEPFGDALVTDQSGRGYHAAPVAERARAHG